MATAKLWWNGSSWVTSSATAIYERKNGQSSLGVSHAIVVAAYDDLTLKMSQSFGAYQTSQIYVDLRITSSPVAVRSGDIPIASSSFADVDVTDYRDFAYSGTAQSAGTENYKPHYSGDISFSGSFSITNPFLSITFDANGGTDAPNAQNALPNVETTLTENIPTRANHTFLGWATSSSAHTPDYSAGDPITISADTTLYAVWMPTVFIQPGEGTKITFNGTAYTSNATVQGLTWGNGYSLLIEPLAGWIIKSQSHPNGTVTIAADETTITATGQRVGCHIDDGNQWVQAVMYMDTGNDWQMVQAYYDNGNSWELVY